MVSMAVLSQENRLAWSSPRLIRAIFLALVAHTRLQLELAWTWL